MSAVALYAFTDLVYMHVTQICTVMIRKLKINLLLFDMSSSPLTASVLKAVAKSDFFFWPATPAAGGFYALSVLVRLLGTLIVLIFLSLGCYNC